MKYLMIAIILLFGCEDNNIENFNSDIVEDNWITIESGEYTKGENGNLAYIDYEYAIMKYEVTNNEYVNFLNEAYSDGIIRVLSWGPIFGYYEGDSLYPEDSSYSFTNTSDMDSIYRISFTDDGLFTIDSMYLNHPVVWLSWYGAHAYAKYYGYELPTTEEWEKAARGDKIWKYPWGNTWYSNITNTWDSGDPYDNSTTPIGFYDGTQKGDYSTRDDSSPYGIHDMNGNVTEWTRSINSETGFRIKKGASFGFNWLPECWIEFGVNYHSNLGFSNGFRCVKY